MVQIRIQCLLSVLPRVPKYTAQPVAFAVNRQLGNLVVLAAHMRVMDILRVALTYMEVSLVTATACMVNQAPIVQDKATAAFLIGLAKSVADIHQSVVDIHHIRGHAM